MRSILAHPDCTKTWGARRAMALALGILCLASAMVAVQAQVTQPLVAIHDSELTRFLDSSNAPASGATPSGAGTTGLQWWPTNWHYFVMPESLKEALRSDGTAFTVVGDSNITAGLLMSNGQPRYPILISLASEAVRDDEIGPLTNYVAAGGFLVVGSSAFTRNTNGTARGDFALASQLGLHTAVAGLTNWTFDSNFTKQLPHRLVNHIPSGTLMWNSASAADEIPWGIYPHPNTPVLPHPVWKTTVADATVLAQGDLYPYLAVKAYGKGYFVYDGAMQPLVGHGGWSPAMYSYVIFRRAIEWAFETLRMPVPKLSPWPYPFDAAFTVRHDMENFTNEDAAIAASAQIEFTNGAKGDYYIVTGTVRDDAYPTFDTNAIIGGLRSAVTNYGATIGSHNGGLVNPSTSSIARGAYEYWHWGPDEALNATPTNYPDGKTYAMVSISNSFNDIEGWLSGVTNGVRTFTGCYFNAVREDSYDVISKLGAKVVGDQKITPFPHWTLSTRTSGKRYQFMSEPVSDWFVSTNIAQSIEPWHAPFVQNSVTLRSGVDFYYGLGALINFYSHTLATGLGDAGQLMPDSLTYGLNATLHPRMWSINGIGMYQWWLQRSNVVVTANFATNGLQTVTTLSIAGAVSTNTAVELFVPGSAAVLGLQVLTNGVVAGSNVFRVNNQVIKVQVGTAVTNAQVKYTPGPSAFPDFYTTAAGRAFSVSPPGALANDFPGWGTNLTALLVSGPTNGTVSLNTNGGFNYVPAAGFSGADAFTYLANDGLMNSGPATVSLLVGASGALFWDNFLRATDPGPLAPWMAMAGHWTVTGGTMQSGSNSPSAYSDVFITNVWSDYQVQAQLKFPAGAYGGGLGGRLNPVTGSHYAAWVYPEGSPGGSNLLKLIKFQSWSSYSYTNAFSQPIAQVSLASVGTGWHTVKLAFSGSQIAVYYDGNQMLSATDVEAAPYTNGSVSVDMWTPSTQYVISAGNVIVGPLAAANSYVVRANSTFTNAAPGVLANDTEVYGTSLTAALVTGPTNGTLNLNANGSFTYRPTTNFTGADSFIYQANDGPTNLGTVAVSLLVIPTNNSPILPTQTYQTITETLPLVVTNTATDPNSPPQVLSYQMLSPPPGASIDTNGVISWTPSQGQGPAVYCLTTVATDNGSPPLGATNSFAVVVNHTNFPPVLPAQTNRSIIGTNTLAVTNTATDPNVPPLVLTYQLQSPPAGASIATNGVITWTPSIAQVPSTNIFTTIVTGNASPVVTATNSFTVTVVAVHNGPSLPGPSTVTNNEMTLLTLTNTATDSDIPPLKLTYTLTLQPTYASNNPAISTNGVITWTPNEAQGPSTNVFTTVVTDNGTPALSATNWITNIVNEINLPPALPVQTTRSMAVLTLLTVTNTATDPDIPTNTLTYALTIAPTNAVIDTNGVITWTPTLAQNNSSNFFQTVVTDYNPWAVNSQHLSATNSFVVIVTNNAIIVLSSTLLAGESCYPTNGAIDPGETVTMLFAVTNVGFGGTTNLVATLLTNSGILAPSAPQSYGVVTPGGGAVSEPFTFSANGACAGTITANLQLQDGPLNLGTQSVSFALGPLLTVLTQSFDSVTTPALPSGWLTSASGVQSNWFTVSTNSDTPPNSVYSIDNTNIGVNELDSPAFFVPPGPAPAQLSFRHRYSFESDNAHPTNGYDGGVLELKIGNGAFLDITNNGGSWVSNGYNRKIDFLWGNPLSNRWAWSGTNAGGFITTIVKLPATASGQTNQLRWRAGADNGNPGGGWWVDSIAVTVYACCTRTPPILPAQADRTNAGLATLVVTNTASDPSAPPNSLTYTLTSAPGGAQIDTNGVITWIPVLAQVPSTNVFTTVVSDSGAPSLSATNSFTDYALAVHNGPVLLAQSNRTTVGLATLTVTNTASDNDVPPLALTYSLLTAPSNAVISSAGVITWTPVVAEVPSTNVFTTVVSDDGTPSLSATNSFTNFVLAVHNGPVLLAQSNRTTVGLATLTVTNTASENDIPPLALTYSLLTAPSNAVISSAGVITWTPVVAQVPSTNVFTTVVSDDGTPSLSATNSFTNFVLAVHSGPVLLAQSNRTTVGLASLTVTNAATCNDIPPLALTYSLQTAPSNAVISTAGVITWTPEVAQVPSTNVFTTVASDSGTPSLSATNSFTNFVLAVHNGPALLAQTNRTVVELTTLLVTNTVTDNDVPPLMLTFSLLNPPAGASIDTNGVINWTPSEAQGPGTDLITTVVTDNGLPPLSATNSFIVGVEESNQPPVLPVQTNRTLIGLTTLVVTNTATDPDLPANMLTYVLDTGPTNAVIDTNGVITWAPVTAQVPSTNLFTTVVTDYNPWAINNQQLSATNSFYVFAVGSPVPPPPITIESISISNNAATITWTAAAGYSYRLQYKASLLDTNWNDILPPVQAAGSTAYATNDVSGLAQRFYRIVLTQ